MPAESALSLVDRLRAALDRAEEIARAAWTEPGAGEWRVTAHGGLAQGPYMLLQPHTVEGSLGSRAVAHIAANDPAVVLRTVAAHRKILDAHAPVEMGIPGAIELFCPTCLKPLCVTLEALAAVYFPEAER